MTIASKEPAQTKKPDDLSLKATTNQLTQWIPLHVETIGRLRRLGVDGPFKEGRDYVFVGFGKGKLIWDVRQVQQSLWSWKKPSEEVETFSREPVPTSR